MTNKKSHLYRCVVLYRDSESDTVLHATTDRMEYVRSGSGEVLDKKNW